MGKNKARGLGRGLNVLISDSETAENASGKLNAAAGDNTDTNQAVHMVAVDKIRENPNQPRTMFDPGQLRDLVESVRRHGVLQPLLVRTRDNRFELIAGERRLRAAREAGLADVPVIVREADDEHSLELALVENLQRTDLNPVEEAEGYQSLIDRFQLTQEQVARRVGKARASIANALRLLSLGDEPLKMLADGRLAVGHAKILLGIADPGRQRMLAMRTAAGHLSVRRLEKLAAAESRRPMRRTARSAGETSLRDDALGRLADDLQRHFATGVRITPAGVSSDGRALKGRIEIDYYSNEDLQRMLDLMGLGDIS